MCVCVCQPPCPPPAVYDVGAAWGHLKDLEAWLHRTPVPRERTTSGGSTCSSSSSFSIEKIDESEFNLEEVEEEEGAELDDWLITPAVVTEPDGESWKQAFRPFHESWTPSEWLPKPCSSCCQASTVAVEIENLGKLVCLKTPSPAPSPASGPAASRLEEAMEVSHGWEGGRLWITRGQRPSTHAYLGGILGQSLSWRNLDGWRTPEYQTQSHLGGVTD